MSGVGDEGTASLVEKVHLDYMRFQVYSFNRVFLHTFTSNYRIHSLQINAFTLASHTFRDWDLNFHCNSAKLIRMTWVCLTTMWAVWLEKWFSFWVCSESFRLFMCTWAQLVLLLISLLPLINFTMKLIPILCQLI